MSAQVKICGLSEPITLAAALDAGAGFVGFMQFPKSPRHVSFERAAPLADLARSRAHVVCVMVDPTDDLVAEAVRVLRPDFLQLHGRETPERVSDVTARYGVPVIKVLSVATAADAAKAADYRGRVPFVMFDAKVAPGEGLGLPGGNGIAFDWTAIQGEADKGPFMLSGGLKPGNVHEAIRLTRAPMVDVSSGVESAPGVKDVGLIRAFVAAATGGCECCR